MDSKNTETWKIIPQHPTHEASTLGRIRRVGASTCLQGTPAMKRRYLTVCVDGQTRSCHRLVAAAHLGLPPGKVVHHVNGCGQDNRVANLEVTTTRANAQYAQIDGTAHTLAGEACPERWGVGHLNPTQVNTLRRAREGGERGAVAALAKQYGVSLQVARDAARRCSYRWVRETAVDTDIARQEALALRAGRKALAKLSRAKAAREANPVTPPATTKTKESK